MVEDAVIEAVARAICESMESDVWDELPPRSVYRAAYIAQACAAIAVYDLTRPAAVDADGVERMHAVLCSVPLYGGSRKLWDFIPCADERRKLAAAALRHTAQSRTNQDARPAAEGVRVIEAVAELQLAAFLAGRGSVTSMQYGTRTAKPAPTMDEFRRMADAALTAPDAVAAAMAERESDGEPYWVDRFGDNVAPERGR